jgi:two-component system, OmpR family, sensor histidine kinase MprB
MTTPFVRRTSFQARLSGLVALAVGLAIALAAVASYFAVSHQLYGQVDKNLTQVVNQIRRSQILDAHMLESRGATAEGFTANGQTASIPGSSDPATNALPGFHPTKSELALATSSPNTLMLTTASFDGTTYRLAIMPGTATTNGQQESAIVVLAETLAPIEHELANLRLILYIVAIGGILVALGLGRLIAKTTIRPVERLTAAAEHVAATQQLDARITETSGDELGRLAHAFNEMMTALSASRRQQAQLVSDAGHELRTPLTSLRTNVELLVRARNLPENERAELTSDVTGQLEELTNLIGDLVELARQEEQQPEPTEIRLDNLVAQAVQRAERRAPSVTFNTSLTAGSVKAQPPMLERAVLNVLDNAAKWSPPGSTVDVMLTRGEHWCLDIRDHGPGIAPDDLSKVFDRFYRAPSARSMPGSGLGLAIVSQVVTSHGGSVIAILPPDGGTLMRIELPIVAEQEPSFEPGTAESGGLGPAPAYPPPALGPAPFAAPASDAHADEDEDAGSVRPPPPWEHNPDGSESESSPWAPSEPSTQR